MLKTFMFGALRTISPERMSVPRACCSDASPIRVVHARAVRKSLIPQLGRVVERWQSWTSGKTEHTTALHLRELRSGTLNIIIDSAAVLPYARLQNRFGSADVPDSVCATKIYVSGAEILCLAISNECSGAWLRNDEDHQPPGNHVLATFSRDYIVPTFRGVLADWYQSLTSEQLSLSDALARLGGIKSVFSIFARKLVRSIAGKQVEVVVPAEPSSYHWALVVAQLSRIDVNVGYSPGVAACLVQTNRSRAIYVSEGLNPEARAFAVCHELAHLWLGHIPGSAYALDPPPDDWILEKRINNQEDEADAFALLMIRLFTYISTFVTNGNPSDQRDLPDDRSCMETRESTAA